MVWEHEVVAYFARGWGSYWGGSAAVMWHIPGVVQLLSLPLLPLSLSIVVQRCCCLSSVVGFPGIVGSQHLWSTPQAVACEAESECIRLALHLVVAAILWDISCNVVVTVELRNKTKKLVTSKKSKETSPGPKQFIWAHFMCDMALLLLCILFPSGCWVGRWVSCGGWVEAAVEKWHCWLLYNNVKKWHHLVHDNEQIHANGLCSPWDI